jgi:hypothetical protein
MKEKKSGHLGQEQAGTAPRKKKAYVAPRLIEYGNVAKLTAAGSGAMSGDAGSMMP